PEPIFATNQGVRVMKNLIMVCGVVIGCMLMTAAPADDKPAPIAALEEQGMEIQGNFDAPSGLTGYVGNYQGQPIAIYVTEDGQHAVVGSMIDADGNDLSEEALSELGDHSDNEALWGELEDSTWIRDGSQDAPRTV